MNYAILRRHCLPLVVLASLFCGASGMAVAQEGEKAKPILGVITHEELLQGKIAYKTPTGFEIKLGEPLTPPILRTKLDIYRGSGKLKVAWIGSNFLGVMGYDERNFLKGRAAVIDLKEQNLRILSEDKARNIHTYSENSALLYEEARTVSILEDQNGKLVQRKTSYDFNSPPDKGDVYYEQFQLCEKFGKTFDFKLSSKNAVICADKPMSNFSTRFLLGVTSSSLNPLLRYKFPIAWSVLSKNFETAGLSNPNGGFYFKGGILHEPLYRDGLEVWEPLTEEPAKSFTPVWGMRVKGGAILADAIKSDKGVCGKEGFSQAYWLKTKKGEQLLYINTKNSYWKMDEVSPNGCKVIVREFSNNYPNCENNKAELVILDICAIQK